MRSSIENFGTGWYGIHIGLDCADIDILIELLQALKKDKDFHFHMFSTAFDVDPTGIADIQFARKDASEGSNMEIGG